MKQSKSNVVPVFNHSHPEYEFIIPVTPIPYLSLDGGIYYGDCGKVYPVQSGSSHGIAYELCNVSHINIIINKEFFENSISKLNNLKQNEFNYEFEVSPRLNILLNLFKEEVSADESCEECIKHISSLICLELALCGLTSEEDTRHKSKYPTVFTVKETADYMIRNPQKEISIDDLAALCNLSPFHYIRKFKQTFSDTPHNYLIKTRLSVAKLLLENTNLPLTEISSKSGFPSPNRFSEVFKQKNNMSPTEYRKMYNKNYNPSIGKAVE